jgi:hypothetical protein
MEELEMFHSVIGADWRTCCKIMAIALAGSISTLMLWISLIISIATWRVDAEAATARAPANGPIIEITRARLPPQSRHQ